MSADAPAKYLNSPDTPLFNKGRLLYNYHQARKPAHDRGTVIAVEGYVDVISLSVAGFHNAVAPLGTALTEDQLALLFRLSDEPTLCFDGDKAGRRAAFRAVDTALPNLVAGKSLRFALLPEGQDPDDLARSGGAGRDRTRAGKRPSAGRYPLGAGDRGRSPRHAGKAGRPRAAASRITCADSRRDVAAILSGGYREPDFGVESGFRGRIDSSASPEARGGIAGVRPRPPPMPD